MEKAEQLFKTGDRVVLNQGWKDKLKQAVDGGILPTDWLGTEYQISDITYDEDENAWILYCDDWLGGMNQVWFTHFKNPTYLPPLTLVYVERVPILD